MIKIQALVRLNIFVFIGSKICSFETLANDHNLSLSSIMNIFLFIHKIRVHLDVFGTNRK